MSELTEVVLSLLAVIVTAATPVLVGYLVQYLRRKMVSVGIEVTAKEMEVIRGLALEGVAFAAQKAKVGVKAGMKIGSSDKKALALSLARKLAKKHGISADKANLLDDAIEAALALDTRL